MEEIAALGDRVTVIRDGRSVGQVPASTPEDELVRLMVGRSIKQQYPRQAPDAGEPLLVVEGLTRDGVFHAKQPADWDRAKGLDVMTNLLQANSGIDGVFAENDEMALGAIKALGAKAGTSVQVIGFDGTPDGLTAVENGTLYASVAQQPAELGRIAVRNAVKAAEGEKLSTSVLVPVKVVTSKNVAEFIG